MAHWEAAIAGAALALGWWLGRPSVWVAALASGLCLLAAIWVVPSRAWRSLPSVAAAAAAAGIALATSLAVRKVETRWAEVREELVELARVRLDRELEYVVELARSLAERALSEGSDSSPSSFERMQRLLRDDAPEHGVAVFDLAARPVSWAGRHRVPPEFGSEELWATITPFYAVIRARRQSEERVALGEVLLAADSAVPDGERSLAARFAKATGVGLEFLTPRQAPAFSGDVFDYCLPSCDSVAPPADTLFSVRAVPPTQGERKVALLQSGFRWVGVWTVVLLVVLAATAGPMVRYAVALGLAALLWFTRVGDALGLEAAFSPAWYYRETLGPLSSSAGALLVAGGLVVALAAGLGRLSVRFGSWAKFAGWALAALAPFWLASLVRGITPPAGGVWTGLWVTWQLSVAIATVALLLLAAWLVKSSGDNPRWRRLAVLSWLWGPAVAALGLWLWQPERSWPTWYLALWLPGFVLAVQPRRKLRSLISAGWIVGLAAALLTWSAIVEGRLALASRDAERLGSALDPVAAGLLERFGSVLRREPVPRSAAALYRLWQRTQLARDGYPAVLVSWGPAGQVGARLQLAELDLPYSLLAASARAARERDSISVEALNWVPGVHYVLAVPYRDGSVVTVGIGPRSRAVPVVRLARFLRGEQALDPPYEFTLGELFPEQARPGIEGWRRYGSVVRGERVLQLPGGPRHLHLSVVLGEPWQLAVRGLLLALVDVVLVGVFWLGGELLAGGWEVGSLLRRLGRPRSYRARLAAVLSVFFVAPTLGFAVWTVARLESEAERSARLLTRQTLRDAAVAGRDLGGARGDVDARLEELALWHGADLILYDSGLLSGSSETILAELGLLDRYLPFPVYRSLALEDELEAAHQSEIGGRRTLVSYRKLGVTDGRWTVLAAPRLVEDAELVQELQDLAYSLILVTLLWLALAIWLAGLAARWLARPIHALRNAAEAIGRGAPLPALGRAVPVEFVPVVEGLERMSQDVRSSQAALEAARQRTAGVLKSVATGVVALDAEMRVTMANPRAEELLGTALPEGTSVADRVMGSWEELWVKVSDFLRRGGGEPEALELTVGDRRIRALVASLGDRAGCVVALDDTTELTHAVRVLAWGELARQIAHEIKNSLTPIRLGVQHLARAYRDRRRGFGQTLEKTVQQILAEIERLDSIARAFSRFGAPPAEAGPLAREDVVAVAREAIQLYALGSPRVRVEGEGPVEALTRRDELKEVLVNLVENSRNAGAREIVVVVEPRVGGGAQLSVRDDGSGIAPEDLCRIFEPHFSTRTSGTGLGLAICRRLVHSWGGAIEVESELGKGTVVRLEIPG